MSTQDIPSRLIRCCCIVLLYVSAGPTLAPAAASVSTTLSHAAMGTEFRFTLYARPGDTGTAPLERIGQAAFAEIDDLENRLSCWRPDSQTTYLNSHAAEEPMRVAPDVLDLIVSAKGVWDVTGGAFDVSVGTLVDLWGFYRGKGHLPAKDEIGRALATVGMDKVNIDANARTVSFTTSGLRLDFGGIAKGLALDRAAQILKDNGVTSAILSAGTSSVVAIGAPPGQDGWIVRIKNPYAADRHLDEVTLKDAALSTSGSYEKFFELGGKRYCHIFDPKTGYPVGGMLSTTVIAPTGMMSDALSTAFFVMGVERTRAYIQRHAAVRAILVPEGPPDALAPVHVGHSRQVRAGH